MTDVAEAVIGLMVIGFGFLILVGALPLFSGSGSATDTSVNGTWGNNSQLTKNIVSFTGSWVQLTPFLFFFLGIVIVAHGLTKK